MNKHLVTTVPLALALLFLSSTQLNAFGNLSTGNNLQDGPSTGIFEATVARAKQAMYINVDTDILQDSSAVSGRLETVAKGTKVLLMGTEGEMCEILTPSGLIGYVQLAKLTSSATSIFNDTDEVKYAVQDAEVKKLPDASSSTVMTFNEDDEVHLIGTNDYDFWKIEKDGAVYYINRSSLKDEKTPEVVLSIGGDFGQDSFTASIASPAWNGAPLTPGAGRIAGPSGQETYYNLNMNGCVSIMRSLGNNDEYWVREDGVKMLGDYVMVAADLSIRPRGSHVETSLGTAVVVDTGSFIYSNPTQIDIAVAW